MLQNNLISDRQAQQDQRIFERQAKFINRQNEEVSTREEAARTARREDADRALQDQIALTIAQGGGGDDPRFNQLRDFAIQQRTAGGFTGATGIDAQTAAGMNLLERQRAVQSRGIHDPSQIQSILGQPQNATLASPAPNVSLTPGAREFEAGREREATVQDTLATLDPRIAAARAAQEGQTSRAGRETPLEAAARIRAEEDARHAAKRANDEIARLGQTGVLDLEQTRVALQARQNIQPIVKDFVTIENAARRIEEGTNDSSPAGDIGIVFGYMKVLDPTSVVREGEQATVQNAGNVSQQLIALYNSLVTTEGRMDATVRADILARALAEAARARQFMDEQIAPTRATLEDAGIPLRFVIPEIGSSPLDRLRREQ